MITITDKQKVTLTLTPKTKAGNASKIEGLPSWGVENTDILSLVVSPDGLSAICIANSTGMTTVFAIADANLGHEITEISGEIQLNVIYSKNLITISSSSPIKV